MNIAYHRSQISNKKAILNLGGRDFKIFGVLVGTKSKAFLHFPPWTFVLYMLIAAYMWEYTSFLCLDKVHTIFFNILNAEYKSSKWFV